MREFKRFRDLSGSEESWLSSGRRGSSPGEAVRRSDPTSVGSHLVAFPPGAIHSRSANAGTRQPRGFPMLDRPSSRLPGERFVAELKPVPSGLGGGRSRGALFHADKNKVRHGAVRPREPCVRIPSEVCSVVACGLGQLVPIAPPNRLLRHAVLVIRSNRLTRLLFSRESCERCRRFQAPTRFSLL